MTETFGLYLILTDPVAGYEACAQAAVDCGVRYLQLRMKDASREALMATAQELRKITRGTRTRFIVNDDLDIAMVCDADGIHLGQDDLTIAEARKRWNTPGKIYGLSTHSLQQAAQARDLAADYIGVGPVFPTATKPDADPALGIEETARICTSTPLTTVAIGGIQSDNLSLLIKAGIDNFCVVGAVNHAPDPAAAIQKLQAISKSSGF
ncbi:MAG: thiamine phosphate synthase [Kiritimatiellales bacterium]|nr:thiamine phosphate synthase [Kiritimatiellales bacterium]